jgi:hypothetical protein
LQTINDPLVTSIFTQGLVEKYDVVSGTLEVEFPKDLAFFADWLKSSEKLWLPVLCATFDKKIALKFLFSGAKKENIIPKQTMQPVTKTSTSQPVSSAITKTIPARQITVNKQSYNQPGRQQQQGSMQQQRSGRYMSAHKQLPSYPIDVSDASIWQKTNLILQYFPGTVREVRT